MKLKSINQLKNLKNKTVLVRVDYNVPIKDGKVMDIERIERSFLTLNYLIKNQAKVILISHLGKPKGSPDKSYSLQPIVKYLNKITKKKVLFVDDCLGEKVIQKIASLKSGQILLLENLRFYPGEESNDKNFASSLADFADIYINDAFSVCHRAHASIVGIPKFLPAYTGFNLLDEIDNLDYLLKGFKRPALAIIGGVKISTKINVIETFLKKYDYVLIGGALANNFFAALDLNIGKSVFEKEYLKLAKELLKKSRAKIIMPIDLRIAKQLSAKSKVEIIDVDELASYKNKNFQIIDIGPKTEIYFESFINLAKTLVWNGPMGVFEIEKFSRGSYYIAQRFSMHAKGSSFGAVGGGETISILEKLNLKKWPDFVSTGGGAMLKFLEGKTLPGIKPLMKK
jgi:phosphoglycerate kinase